MEKTKKYYIIVIVIAILIWSCFFIYGYAESLKPYEITEIGCGTVEQVERNTIYFGNDSFSGIVKDDGFIQWDRLNPWGFALEIDNLNGYDISNLTGKYVELRIHGIMNTEGTLVSKIILLEVFV